MISSLNRYTSISFIIKLYRLDTPMFCVQKLVYHISKGNRYTIFVHRHKPALASTVSSNDLCQPKEVCILASNSWIILQTTDCFQDPTWPCIHVQINLQTQSDRAERECTAPAENCYKEYSREPTLQPSVHHLWLLTTRPLITTLIHKCGSAEEHSWDMLKCFATFFPP